LRRLYRGESSYRTRGEKKNGDAKDVFDRALGKEEDLNRDLLKRGKEVALAKREKSRDQLRGGE